MKTTTNCTRRQPLKAKYVRSNCILMQNAECKMQISKLLIVFNEQTPSANPNTYEMMRCIAFAFASSTLKEVKWGGLERSVVKAIKLTMKNLCHKQIMIITIRRRRRRWRWRGAALTDSFFLHYTDTNTKGDPDAKWDLDKGYDAFCMTMPPLRRRQEQPKSGLR